MDASVKIECNRRTIGEGRGRESREIRGNERRERRGKERGV